MLMTPLMVDDNDRTAVSMRDILRVPLGWCSSGLREKEYTLIP